LDGLNRDEPEAFDSLFRCYYASLCYFAERIAGSPQAAEDIVQGVFLNFYERRPHFENSAAMRSYLYRAVGNNSLKYIERQRRRVGMVDNIPDPKTDDDLHHIAIETRVIEAVFDAIAALPEACRRIFEMSYIERLSVADICRALGVTENTVKTQRLRAKKMLRERLHGLYRLLSFIFF
jgi:RNA polymerase sigma-70 factor (ECF subfamily)